MERAGTGLSSDSRGSHAREVEAYLAQIHQPSLLLSQADRAVRALWDRMSSRLGEVTVRAIVERVVVLTGTRSPCLGGLRVKDGHIDFDGLRAHVATHACPDLRGAIASLLVELLTVVGNLTAEVLTPSLHACLEELGPEEASR